MSRTWEARDGFIGHQIGSYVTREGLTGLVLQQIGTKVVHVYQLRYLTEINESSAPAKEG